MTLTFKQIMVIFYLLFTSIVYAQYANSYTIKKLDKLIQDENYSEAELYLKQSIDTFKYKKDYYLLTDYIYYTGKINLQLFDKAKAEKAVQDYVETLITATDSAKVIRQVKLELASYHQSIGNPKKAYDLNLEALDWTFKWTEATPEHFGLVENNLSVYATRKGDIATGIKHGKNAIKYYESYPKTRKVCLYIVYNTLGSSMWYESKIDSALVYYLKAEKTLKLMEPTPLNLYYRPATLNNNMHSIYSTQGNWEKSLDAMKKTISYLNEFIKADISGAYKEEGTTFLFSAIENYAAIYKDMGDFEKAKELLEYSYNEKRLYFEPESPELFKSKVLLGDIYLALKDYKKSKLYLDEGIKHIEDVNGGNSFWLADAYYFKAKLNTELGNIEVAKQYFVKAENQYEAVLGGAYDELYLDFIIKASHFYANHNEKEKALAISEKAYKYVKKNQGETTSLEIQQVLNIGEIYYKIGDYTLALEKGNKTLELITNSKPKQTNLKDSTQIIFHKPQATLLRSKSRYQLQNDKNNLTFLKNEFKEIKEAIYLLERQKTLVGEGNNVSILIENNASIFEYAKQLALRLFKSTKEDVYLYEIISLHESILYNRIRTRLNSQYSIAYANIPNSLLDKEKTIKENLKKALNQSDNIDAFFNADKEWNMYMQQLKKEHPKYFKLRFGSISKSLENISTKLPENTSVVRYLYLDKDLYAIVINKENSRLFELNSFNLLSNIEKIQSENALFENHFKEYNELYNTLWKPFEYEINTDHVIIIPDQDLFNINFEMLTTSLVTNFKELKDKSLLSKYYISYNYSLLLLNEKSKTIGYNDNFVAFAPEFNDKMKNDYRIGISDSISVDKTYLNLLPQPFSVNLAKEYTKLFNGSSFLNEKASKHIFTNNAKEHKIIHIGTHAESNNISPELSRLIFAKNVNDTISSEGNSLYTYEIYNQNLSSNLAILTACETGKPTYQAGEGMISLAHAFNYAGSESILTSLWKIDEQSSVEIIDHFYGNLKEGLPKDEALQKAKLEYLATAQGRTLSPQYWAGLVLIGDASPIDLQTNSNWVFWLLGGVFIILMIVLIRRKRNA